MRPILLSFVAAVLLGPWHGAWAGGFTVEGPSYRARAEAADAVERLGTDVGRPRVVRVWIADAGWRYRLVVEEVEDRVVAAALARRIADTLGGTASVFAVDGEQASLVQTAVVDEAVEQRERTRPLLVRAAAAHRDEGLSAETLEAAIEVRFRFRRTAADGTVREHLWRRRAGEVSVEVVGEGDPVRVVRDAEAARLSAGSNEPVVVDPGRAAEVLDVLSPEGVLGGVLSAEALLDAAAEVADLEVRPDVSIDGARCAVVALGRTGPAGVRELAVDRERLLLRRVARVGVDGPYVQQFDDWSLPVGGALLPRRIRTLRPGGEDDQVEVMELVLDTPQTPP